MFQKISFNNSVISKIGHVLGHFQKKFETYVVNQNV